MTGHAPNPGRSAQLVYYVSYYTAVTSDLPASSSLFAKNRAFMPGVDLVDCTGDLRHQELNILHVWAIAL